MLKRFFLCALLLSLCLLPGTARADYLVTEDQMQELSAIYTTLSEKSTEQQTLLTGQKTQIETLSKQLKTSNEEISASKNRLEQAQKQLNDLESSWKKSEDKNRQTEQRLKRQRDTWAVLSVLILGAAVCRS